MQIGAMNHPGREVLKEIAWIAERGFDFVDLTLEPPLAAAGQVDARSIGAALSDLGLGVVGHTAYYLPICSPFESIRRSAVAELAHCAEVFARLGAEWMNLHPDAQCPFSERKVVIEKNLQSIRELQAVATEQGIGLMVENLPGSFNSADQMAELLQPLPELGLHLDIGHGNLMSRENTADGLLASFGDRLKHVHLHDNKGGSADLHLPLGAGNVDVRRYIQKLQDEGYDGTITLEVFTSDQQLLAYSKEVLRSLWDQCAERTKTELSR